MNRRLGALIFVVAAGGIAAAVWSTFHRDANAVVVYVSEDQVFSEPILKDFERETGVKVRAVFDTEGNQERRCDEPPDR